MREALLSIFGIVGCVTSMQLTEWVGIICTLAITLTTCGINIYRMIRDRNSDKEVNNEEKGEIYNGKED